jgi:hypothetical protein
MLVHDLEQQQQGVRRELQDAVVQLQAAQLLQRLALEVLLQVQVVQQQVVVRCCMQMCGLRCPTCRSWWLVRTGRGAAPSGVGGS